MRRVGRMMKRRHTLSLLLRLRLRLLLLLLGRLRLLMQGWAEAHVASGGAVHRGSARLLIVRLLSDHVLVARTALVRHSHACYHTLLLLLLLLSRVVLLLLLAVLLLVLLLLHLVAHGGRFRLVAVLRYVLPGVGPGLGHHLVVMSLHLRVGVALALPGLHGRVHAHGVGSSQVRVLLLHRIYAGIRVARVLSRLAGTSPLLGACAGASAHLTRVGRGSRAGSWSWDHATLRHAAGSTGVVGAQIWVKHAGAGSGALLMLRALQWVGCSSGSWRGAVFRSTERR